MVVLGAVVLLASCGVTKPGDLDPSCIRGSCVFVSGAPRPLDGRDMAFTAITSNESASDSISLLSVKLVDAVGMELVDTVTVSPNNQIGIGLPIPPEPGDFDSTGVPESEADQVANWAKRTSLADSVIPPGNALQLVLVIRVTSPDQCVYAKGFTVTYKQGNRSHSVDSNHGFIAHTSDDPCDATTEYLLSHPF